MSIAFNTEKLKTHDQKEAQQALSGKLKGNPKCPPRVGLNEIFWSWIGAFFGIALLSYINFKVVDESDFVLLVGSFGASAVLIYGAIQSPLAQPRNLIGGHVLSAIVGVTCFKLFSSHLWLAASLAVASAIAVMHLSRTLHPPGGATALIAVIGSNKIHSLGYMYSIIPVGVGATIMLIIAVIVNNIPKDRKYPDYWL